MAGIDKTYIDPADYPTYRKWWIDNHEKMVSDLGKAIYMLTFWSLDVDVVTPGVLLTNDSDLKEHKGLSRDFPVWNTSESQDIWLVKNCQIISFQDRMREVYPGNWRGFKGVKIKRVKLRQKSKADARAYVRKHLGR